MEKINTNRIISGLGISSSRASACIAVLGEGGSPDIIGLGRSEGKLMGGKGVLDIDALSKAIKDSIGIAQEEAGVESQRAIVSISGANIKSEKSRGMIRLGQRGEEITDREIREVLKVADTVPMDIEREIMHSIPQDFVVDGQEGVKNPVGLYGVKLEAETLLITIHAPFLQNIIKSLNLAGIELEDAVFSGIAASRCLLSPEETEGKGIVLMEIDNNFTALSVFFDKILRSVYIQQESVIADGALKTLKEKVDKIRCNKAISKIILTGGSYFHEDFIEKVDSVFGVPSQMAYARNVKGSARDINNPSYANSIGGALYGLEKKKEKLVRKRGGIGLFHKATRKVSDFIGEYF